MRGSPYSSRGRSTASAPGCGDSGGAWVASVLASHLRAACGAAKLVPRPRERLALRVPIISNPGSATDCSVTASQSAPRVRWQPQRTGAFTPARSPCAGVPCAAVHAPALIAARHPDLVRIPAARSQQTACTRDAHRIGGGDSWRRRHKTAGVGALRHTGALAAPTGVGVDWLHGLAAIGRQRQAPNAGWRSRCLQVVVGPLGRPHSDQHLALRWLVRAAAHALADDHTLRGQQAAWRS